MIKKYNLIFCNSIFVSKRIWSDTESKNLNLYRMFYNTATTSKICLFNVPDIFLSTVLLFISFNLMFVYPFLCSSTHFCIGCVFEMREATLSARGNFFPFKNLGKLKNEWKLFCIFVFLSSSWWIIDRKGLKCVYFFFTKILFCSEFVERPLQNRWNIFFSLNFCQVSSLVWGS